MNKTGKNAIEKINTTKRWYFLNSSKIDKPLGKTDKEKCINKSSQILRYEQDNKPRIWQYFRWNGQNPWKTTYKN